MVAEECGDEEVKLPVFFFFLMLMVWPGSFIFLIIFVSSIDRAGISIKLIWRGIPLKKKAHLKVI